MCSLPTSAFRPFPMSRKSKIIETDSALIEALRVAVRALKDAGMRSAEVGALAIHEAARHTPVSKEGD